MCLLLFYFCQINITMIDMYTQKTTLAEGKYGYKFDQFIASFEEQGKVL